jgi:hypothetical protein
MGEFTRSVIYLALVALPKIQERAAKVQGGFMDLKQSVSYISSVAKRRIGWRVLHPCAGCDAPAISRAVINGGGYTLGIALIFFLQEY